MPHSRFLPAFLLSLREAEQRLGEFEDKWDGAYLAISQSWRRNWPRIIPFFDYPPEIRKVIYTTNAIESVNMSLRKITKNRNPHTRPITAWHSTQDALVHSHPW